jgi:sugar phosphate isomerase/epimerase
VQAVLGIQERATTTDEAWSKYLSDAAAAGVGAIELPSDTPPAWMSQAADHGLRVVVLRSSAAGPDCHLAAVDPAARTAAISRVKAELDQAAEAGVDVVTVAPASGRRDGQQPPAGTYADALHATLVSLRALAKATERTGRTVAVEPNDGFLLSPVEFRDLLDLVNRPQITACLDLPRIARSGWIGDWLEVLRYRVGCVRWNEREGPDADAVAAALVRVGYTGPVVCDDVPTQAARQLGRLQSAATGT